MNIGAIAIALLATAEPREIPATITKVTDGDTFVVLAHLGLGVHLTVKVRLSGVNSPEVKGLTKKAGLAAKAYSETWAATYPDVVIVVKGKSFDRYVATVCPPAGGICLSEALVGAGHAVVYDHKAEQKKRRARARRKARSK